MATLLPSEWVRAVRPKEDARFRLICFPHAGGGAHAFADWDIPASATSGLSVEICAVSTPGRGSRAGEPLPQNLADLAAAAAAGLHSCGALQLPYAFFGHSLGALLAYEVALCLSRMGVQAPTLIAPQHPQATGPSTPTSALPPPLPLHIFASSAEAPCAARLRRSRGAAAAASASLPDAEFLASLRRYGFSPGDIAGEDTAASASPEPRQDTPPPPPTTTTPPEQQGGGEGIPLRTGGLLSAVLPALRADIAMLEAYPGNAERLPSGVAVSVMSGDADESISLEGIDAWRNHLAEGPTLEEDVEEEGEGSGAGCREGGGLGGSAMCCGADAGRFSSKSFRGGGHFYHADSPEALKAAAGFIGESIARSYSTLPRAVAWGGDAAHLHETRCVHEIFRDVAAASPDRIAVVDEPRGDVTYADLWEMVAKLGGLISSRKPQSSDALEGHRSLTVGLMLPHSADYIASMLGIWASGGCLLVLEGHHPRDMLTRVCSTCNPDGSGVPDLVITTSNLLQNLRETPLESAPTLLLDPGWDLSRDATLLGERFTPAPGDLTRRAILMTTSGTSGDPKLIEGSQRFQLIGMLSRDVRAPYLTACEEREACSVMFVWEAPRSLLKGLTCVVIPEATLMDPARFAGFLVEKRATRVLTTPSLASVVLDHLQASPDCCASLQRTLHTWFLMGEICPTSLVERFLRSAPAVRAVNAYSTWEAADTCILPCTADHLSRFSKAFPVGRLHEGVHAAVVDPETLRPLPYGVPGELYTAGPQLANGYSMSPGLTAERYRRVGIVSPPFGGVGGRSAAKSAGGGGVLSGGETWYKSGDLAVMREAGRGGAGGGVPILELFGRIDSTVKIRGFKVGLSFVEGAVLECPEVALAVVVPTLSRATGQPDSLAALVLPDPAALAEAGGEFSRLVPRIREATAAKVPKSALPRFFLSIAAVLGEGRSLRQGGEAKKLNRRAIPKLYTEDLLLQQQQAGAGRAQQRQRHQHQGLAQQIREVWCSVLHLGDPSAFDGDDETFFDLGGHSLLAPDVVRRVAGLPGAPRGLSVVDLYANATLSRLTEFVEARAAAERGDATPPQRATAPSRIPPPPPAPTSPPRHATDIAVVGMAGVFPGASDINEFWENLKAGEVSTTHLSDDLLRRKGHGEATLGHPDYVKVAYKVENAEGFDAQFWGIGRGEAAIMDPQHRLFIETAYHAVENAGYAPRSGDLEGSGGKGVAVYAAAGIDGYLIHHLKGGALGNPLQPGELFLTELGSEKDYIATRVSYLLGLTGPSVSVNTACSSGLVATAHACAALHLGECDAAIAGASSVSFPNTGYLFQEGLVYSRGGVVRPFDQGADGTVFGDSVGAVVLKRLSDAERDGDNIWCVIKGHGVTNDGGAKAGFAAPSAAGQAACIRRAMEMSGVAPPSVSYVEMHATGTLVGDGIEARGLAEAWDSLQKGREAPPRATAVGSVKGNIGHANCAAGITGLIKTALMLRHRTLVPTAGFRSLNSSVRLEGTPFFVNTECRAWGKGGSSGSDTPGEPLRAGVSSFGIGGTNAHIVLEGYGLPTDTDTAVAAAAAAHPEEVLLFSGRTAGALRRNMESVAVFLERGGWGVGGPPLLRDVAFTLRRGRDPHPLRRAVRVPEGRCPDAARRIRDAAAALPAATTTTAPPRRRGSPTIAFLFPGQGTQHPGMGSGLLRLPTFGTAFRRCVTLFEAEGSATGAPPLGPAAAACHAGAPGSEDTLSDPRVLQPFLFSVEYAMAVTLSHLGVRPSALCGHSIGECAAAAASGLLPLPEAVRLVALRAAATAATPAHGAMLSLKGVSAEAAADTIRTAGLAGEAWVAASNSPTQCVVAATPAGADALRAALTPPASAALLHVNRAFHSPLMASAAATLHSAAFAGPQGGSLSRENGEGERRLPPGRAAPHIPTTSNVSGSWLSRPDAESGAYWERHMGGAVLFRECAASLLSDVNPGVCIEVGPGGTLCTLLGRCCPEGAPRPALEQSMRHAKAEGGVDADVAVLGGLLCSLYALGVPVRWDVWRAELHGGRGGAGGAGEEPAPRRIHLPGYSFEPTPFWKNPAASIYVDSPEEGNGNVVASGGGDTSGGISGSCLVECGGRGVGGGGGGGVDVVLYCFPYAGGSSRAFERWQAGLSGRIRVVAVELPGRGARVAERHLGSEADDTREIGAVAAAIERDACGLPFAFVGKSMGCLVACAVSRALSTPAQQQLLGIVAAGRRPVRDVGAFTGGPPHYDPASIESYALAPREARATPAWSEYLMPLLQADLRCDTRLEHTLSLTLRGGGPLLPPGARLQVLCATNDDIFPCSEAEAWRRATATPTLFDAVQYLPGSHAFLTDLSGGIAERAARCAIGWLVARRTAELASLHDLHAAPTAPSATTAPPAPTYTVQWEPAGSVNLTHTGPTPMPALPVFTAALPAWGTPDMQRVLQAGGRAALHIASTGLPAMEAACWEAVRWAQSLAGAPSAPPPLAVALLLPGSPEGGLLAGLARAIPCEIPEVRVARVFLKGGPPWGALPPQALQAAASFALASGETDLLLDPTGAATAPRLAPMPWGSAPPTPPVLPPGIGLVVTGWTGGLGREVVAWLLKSGVVAQPAQLLLVSRGGGPAEAPPGCRVAAVGDMADESAVSAALSGQVRRGERLAVMHLAGCLRDSVLLNQTREVMQAPIDAKVHTLLAVLAGVQAATGSPAEWLLSFSSTSSLFGFPGQGNYCAANGFLDAFTLFGPLPRAASISWGPWGEVGMARQGTKAHALALKDGDIPLATAAALSSLGAALSRLVGGPAVRLQVAVCDLVLESSPWRRLPILRRVVGQQQEEGCGGVPSGSSGPVEGRLRQWLAHEVGAESWEAVADEDMASLGVDSLDTVQLRNAFNKAFEVNAPLSLFTKPNLEMRTLHDSLTRFCDAGSS